MIEDRRRRPRGDAGQATLEQIGVLAVVAVVVAAVVLAFTGNAAAIGSGAARLVCRVLTPGQGDCGAGGGSAGAPAAREPDVPCLVRADGDVVDLSGGLAVLTAGEDIGLTTEERSDGSYRLERSTGSRSGAEVGAGAGVGFDLTVDDVDVSAGGSVGAGVDAEIVFREGQEWVVASEAERDAIARADAWSRADWAVGKVGRSAEAARPGSGAGLLAWVYGAARTALGPQLPTPERVYVAGGVDVAGTAAIGAGPEQASVSAGTSVALGRSYAPEDPDEVTYYFSTVLDGEVAAAAVDVRELDLDGADLSGRAETLTSITVRDGELVEASRTGVATAGGSGLAAAIFGEDATTDLSRSGADGTQYTATLRIDDAGDEQAVLAMLASSGIDAAGAGLTTTLTPDAPLDPLSARFVDRVKSDGDLTRTGVTRTDSTVAAGSGGVEVGPVEVSAGADYSRTSQVYGTPEYFDGTSFVSRTTC